MDSRWCARSNFLVKCFEQKLHRRSSDGDDEAVDLGDDDGADLGLFPPPLTAFPSMEFWGRNCTLSIFNAAI